MPTDQDCTAAARLLMDYASGKPTERQDLAELVLPHRPSPQYFNHPLGVPFPTRQEVAEAFSRLEERIYIARNNYLCTTGHYPKEVWVGPEEARIIEAERNWQSMEGRIVHDPATTDAILRGEVEGARIMGLHVRRMLDPGVRVGTTTAG